MPGSSRVGPVVYIDAVLAGMPPPVRDGAIASIDALDPERLGEQERTPEFAFVRALACEAFYSDFVEPGRDVDGAWAEIDFDPAGRAAAPQGLVVAGSFVKDRFEVIVVGSGAGGGVVAGELAQRGRDVLLLEAGPHLTAVDFDRWEAKANARRSGGRSASAPCPTATWSRSSQGAASAGRPRSTRRWRCGRTSRTSPSGTARAA